MRRRLLFSVVVATLMVPVGAPAGVISTVAGGNTDIDGEDARYMAWYYQNNTDFVGMTPNNDILLTSWNACRVWRVTPGGVVTIVAGTGSCSFSGDGGLAVNARVRPADAAEDSQGNVYIADYYNHRVRRVDAMTGNISTVAGTGGCCNGGDGGPAVNAQVYYPRSIGIDGSDNVYVFSTSSGGCRVRVIDAMTQNISRLAGTSCSSPQPGTPATNGRLNDSATMSVTPDGTVFFSQWSYSEVWRIDAGGTSMYEVVGGLSTPSGVAAVADGAGDWDFYVSTYSDDRLRYYDTSAGSLTDIAVSTSSPFKNGQPAISGNWFDRAGTVVVDSNGNIYWAFGSGQLIYRLIKIDTMGIATHFAGNGRTNINENNPLGNGDPLTSGFIEIGDIEPDGAGGFYISDAGAHTVRHVDNMGVMTAFAGTGINGFSGDGGPAVDASLYTPYGLAVDPNTGDLFIGDYNNARVRRVSFATGNIDTVAGSPTPYSVSNVRGIDWTANDTLLIHSRGARRVYELDIGVSIVSVAGNGSSSPDQSTTVPLSSVRINDGWGVAALPNGDFVFTDASGYHRIRYGDVSAGEASVLAGVGASAYNGENIPAAFSPLGYPRHVGVDPAGNIMVAEWNNHRVRIIDNARMIYTLAGNGTSSPGGGDGGDARAASLQNPVSVVYDAAGGGIIAAERQLVRFVVPEPPTLDLIDVITPSVRRDGVASIAVEASDGEINPSGLLVTVETRPISGTDADYVANPVNYNAGSGQFDATFSPAPSAPAEAHLVRVTVNDGSAIDQQVAMSNIAVTNVPPAIVGIIPNEIRDQGISISYNLKPFESDYEDADPDLTWSVIFGGMSAAQLDTNLSDPTNDIFVIEPVSAVFSGQETVTFRLTDKDGDFVEQMVTLEWRQLVVGGNTAPVWMPPIGPVVLGFGGMDTCAIRLSDFAVDAETMDSTMLGYTLASVSDPGVGVSILPNNCLSVNPGMFFGTAFVAVEVSDGALSDFEFIRIDVAGPSPGGDTDGDGMTDAWEVQFGLNPMVNDANLDPDGDNLTNKEEFDAGSNPQLYNGPTQAVIVNPADRQTINSLMPNIVAQTPGDNDYNLSGGQFELYRGVVLGGTAVDSATVSPGTSGFTNWTPGTALSENTSYTVRARGEDPNVFGPWSAPVTFHVNVANDGPDTPTPLFPAGRGFFSTRPHFLAAGANDPDGDPLTYTFEVFSDAGATNMVGSATGLLAAGGTVSWGSATDLDKDVSYYWRARSNDGAMDSPFSNLIEFIIQEIPAPIVNVENPNPGTPPAEQPPVAQPEGGCAATAPGGWFGLAGLLAVLRRRKRR